MRVVRSSLPAAVFALIVVASVAAPAAGDGPDEPKGLRAHESKQFAAGPPSELVADNFDVLGHVNLGGGSPNGDVFFFDHGGDVGKFA